MKKGWETKRLGDVCGFQNGFAFKSSTFRQRGCPILRISNIQDERVDSETLVFFKPEDYSQNLDRYRIVQGDLLIAMSGATTGKVGFNTEQTVFYLNQRIGKFEPSPKLNKRFLFYFLSNQVEKNLRISAGAAQPNLSTNQIKGFVLPLPSLTEQQRIVGMLDEAFADLAVAQTSLEKNLQNAQAIFESHLQLVFANRNNGWVEKKLGAVAEFKNGLNYTRESKGQTLPVVGVGDFQSNTIVPLEQLQTARIDGKLSPEYAIQAGDILTVRSNGSKNLVGRSMLVPEVSRTTSYSGFIIRVRVNPAEVFPAFLLHLMKSRTIRDRLVRDGGGANISNINQTKLAALPISLPSIADQKKIVAQLDALASETQRLTLLYKQKLAALSELKKSLLHQAFTGEL